MATYYLYLRSKADAKKATTIMARIRDRKDQVKFSTNIKVLPSHWDEGRQRVTDADTLAAYKNAGLMSWCTEMEKAMLRKDEEGWSLEDVRDAVFRAKGLEPVERRDPSDNSFLLYYHKWATTRTQSKTPNKQCLLSWKIVSEFRSPIAFHSVDARFYEDFCRWMDDVKHYKTNMKGTQIKNLKAVMNAAYKEGLHTYTAYHNFKKPQEEVDNVYLTEEELDALYNLPLTGYKAKARDIFLVGCYTAMRWSDYSRLSDKDIVDDTIYFTHKKTGYRVSIPLHPIVREILDRYDGAVPEISDQKLNKYIKEVCKDAGITQPATRVYYKGGERVEEVRPKCELVSSHTARRTAATNMYKSGVPAYNIMLITGHTSEATFRKYIKFEKERNAELMRDNPYFKKRGSGSTPSGR